MRIESRDTYDIENSCMPLGNMRKFILAERLTNTVIKHEDIKYKIPPHLPLPKGGNALLFSALRRICRGEGKEGKRKIF